MICTMCDGTRVPTVRTRSVERDGRTVVVRDVPVEVCYTCGEVYLDAEVAMWLDDLFRQMLDGPAWQA